MYVFFIGIALYMLATAQQWNFMARIGPTVVAGILIAAGTVSLANKVFFTSARAGQAQAGLHMDVGSDHEGAVPEKVALRRAMAFLGWLLGFLACTSVIGLIPTVPLFIVAFMRIEGRESWWTSVILAICVTAFLYGIFDQVLHIPWPSSLLGEWFPALTIGGA
ncbi:tripartite tricarboxylate transporter TctB family protein [Massilia phosphatilytica]